ncbi:TetR/AcrR family transcriptional regulator [Nocardia uniformis]|uniref:TetR/AcrR family transcriptional regulator n=1 Tax=Nocardia uniformis TaxID=53432 RepID=UPI0008335739|nr:TetR/AcrR family transcriptional regulator [Nocardia uniformis]
MNTAPDLSRARPTTSRGRIDKQQAVLAAAFTVFARTGYAQARVDDIAAEARVAKATVYNHFGDKETLLRESVRALSDNALAANLAAVEQLENVGDDLAATLRAVGSQLAACYCADDSQTLRRLVCAEALQFPDLLDIVDAVSKRVTRALADRLARLTLSGTLDIDDPDMAAAQFAALLTGPADARSRLGTGPLPDRELRTIADAAVTTFLAAYGR